MSYSWLLAMLPVLGVAWALYAAEPYPRSIALPKNGAEPACRSTEVDADKSTKLVMHEWAPAKPGETAPVVLLVHGIGMHGKPYEAIAAGFTSKGMVLVAPDLRGHGASGGEHGAMPDAATLRDDLDAIVDYIQTRYPKSPVFLMGESMGGLIAADYAVRKQKRLAGLVLFAPAFSIHSANLKATSTFMGFVKSGKVAIHGKEFLHASSRDDGFAKACEQDPLGLYEVKAAYLAQLGKMGLDWPMAGSHLKLPLYMAVGGEDKIIDNQAARRAWARAKATKKDKVWREWKEAWHTLCWDPLTTDIIADLCDWIESRVKP